MNRCLTASDDDSGGLGIRAKNDSALLESIDSRQMVCNLSASQKFMKMDFFLTFTCNQREHFGTKPIKLWTDSDEWMKHFPKVGNLKASEIKELKRALIQASAALVLRVWQEVCHLFLSYLKHSDSSPYKKAVAIFARHESQKDVGSLPHIHAMLKVNWDTMSCDKKNL